MTVRCFVDASLLLQARDARDPLKQARAVEWLDRLWQQRSGRTSVQVLAEFYVMATQKLSPRVAEDLAWDELTRYLAWTPQETNEGLLRRAREIERRYHLAWWDSAVVAAALMQDCLILLSEELPDGAVFGALAVRNPYGSVLEEPAAEYAVARAEPLHRPRGRPRRPTASSARGPRAP
jgi:predicted nucleic acid-binding protein